jgi:hypothetical protein
MFALEGCADPFAVELIILIRGSDRILYEDKLALAMFILESQVLYTDQQERVLTPLTGPGRLFIL